MPGNGICAVVRICNDQQISVLLENKGDTDVLMKVPEKGFDYIVRYYNVDGDERIKDCSNTTCYAYALRPLIHAKCDVDEIDNLMCVYGFKIPLPPDAELLNEVELIIPLIPVDFARPVNSLESIDSRIQTIHVKAKSDTFE